MYDSTTHYIYEGVHFTLKSDRFFDGWSTKKIDGRYDIKTRFVSSLRQSEIKNKRYYPMIELVELTMGKGATKRRVRRIETQISMPKSCFGTSKYEMGFDDYSFFIKKNLEYLQMADVNIDLNSVKNAIIAELATPKSIILPPYFGEAVQNIRKLCPFNHKPRSRFRTKEYEDGLKGISMNFNNDIRGTCIYCKYSEILVNGYTLEEEEIMNDVLSGKQRKNIIRIEPSFFKQQTLEAVLRRFILNKKKDFTLNDLFTNGNISQKILLEEFDKVFSPLNIMIISMAEMQNNQLDYLLKKEGLSFDERARLYYMVNIAIKFGLNQLWEQLKGEVSSSTYYRIRKSALKVIELKGELEKMKEPIEGLVGFLRGEIEKFELIKPATHKESRQLSLKTFTKQLQ